MKKLSKADIRIFLCLHLLLLVYSFGGIFSKLAASQPFLSLKYILYYGIVLFVLMIYAVVWQQIIKKLPLIVAYASKAVTVIWGVVWGMLFFQENITLQNILGAIIIVTGIVIVDSEEE